MINRFINKKVMVILFAVGALLIAIFNSGLYNPADLPLNVPPQGTAQQVNSKEAKVVSTDPAKLDGVTILPTQKITVSFDHQLVNGDEVKHRIEPEAKHTIKLSDDHMSAIISPDPSFPVGQGFTLFISNETKFLDGSKLSDSKEFHFRTIEYRGI